MIRYIEGKLLKKEEDRIVVLANGVGYEILLPAIVRQTFNSKKAGDDGDLVKLYIHYHQTERQPKPLLIGFNFEPEKEFFEKFITVEAIGPPTAVKALVLPIPHIAKAIEERDAKALERLKGIGKRTADKIIASLQGKVGKFALMREDEIQEPSDVVDFAKQVEEVLVKDLGHRLTEAQRLVKEAMLRNPGMSTPEELFEEVYRGQKKNIFMKETEKKTDGPAAPEEQVEDFLDLRPQRLFEYIGQSQVVETLEIAIQAAKKRGEPLDHILFHSPPGLGKTTLAHIIARELDVHIVTSSGPAIEKGGDLISILTHLERGDVLFLDEIHRLPKIVEEFLYPAMEDFCIDFIFDKGAHARSHRYRLERFTLVGATTRAGLLSAPLRERFGILRTLDFYTVEELCQVIKRSAAILKVPIDESGTLEIAKRSRGTPRISNRLLKRVRDFAEVRGQGKINREIANEALVLEGVDESGLTSLDRRFLETVIRYYKGGPVGLEAIAATLQEESDTLVDMIEPFLLKIGFIARMQNGRRATELAYQHFGLPYSESGRQLSLPTPKKR